MEGLRSTLEHIAQKHLRNSSLDGLVSSNIKPKKIDNINKVYDFNGDKIFFLYDGTLFGSAKEGMVFTDKGIYWKDKLFAPEQLTYREIVESTANVNVNSRKNILVFSNKKSARIDETYYSVICDIRQELIQSYPIYRSYYMDILTYFEKSLEEITIKGEWFGIIDQLNNYEGLFLEKDDKSVRVREIEFKAFLQEEWFSDAERVLESLRDVSPVIYERLKEELDIAVKDSKFNELNEKRIEAIKNENFNEAYSLLYAQNELNIRDEEELVRIEVEIKQAHFSSLESNRLKNIENENFNEAFAILDQQENLQIISESEIEETRIEMKELKIELIEKYYEKLKEQVDGEQFLEAELKIKQIENIDPNVPLDREKILLMIYQYKLEEAKEAISNLSDERLKLELEEVLNLHTRMLWEEIRDAVRHKDYDFFEIFPNIWNNKDEYSMSPLHYFALGGDEKGLIEALKDTKYPFISANIFGHNFIDLLGFACDPYLGNSELDVVEILNSISYDYDDKKLKDRIKYLETGNSIKIQHYNLPQDVLDKLDEEEIKHIQEKRLSYFNQKLVSTDYFSHVLGSIEEQYSNEDRDDNQSIQVRDNEIGVHMFFNSFEDEDYPSKDEFETSEAYQNTVYEFQQEKLSNVEATKDVKDYYQEKIDEINKLLDTKENYLIKDLLLVISLKEEGRQILENLEDEEYLYKLYDVYFPIKAPTVEMGIYDADREVFLMIINKKIVEMKVPLEHAKEFKESFPELNYTNRRIFEDDKIVDILIYRFNEDQYSLPVEVRQIHS